MDDQDFNTRKHVTNLDHYYQPISLTFKLPCWCGHNKHINITLSSIYCAVDHLLKKALNILHVFNFEGYYDGQEVVAANIYQYWIE